MAIIATTIVAGMHVLIGLVALMHDVDAQPGVPNNLDWSHAIASAVWIGAFVGGTIGCLLHVVAWLTTGVEVDGEIVNTQMLTTNETMELEQWIEAKQGRWEQLRRLWS
jgi:hypothetical protein